MNQRRIGVIINYLCLAFNVFIGLFYTPYFISKLGDNQYGIYSLANSLVAFVTLLDLGFGQTMIRYLAKTRAVGDNLEEWKLNGFFLKSYTIIAIIALILGLCILLIYPYFIAHTFNSDEIVLFRYVFFIFLINIVISFPLSVFSATLSAYEKFFFLKAVGLFVEVFKYIALFMLMFFGFQLVSVAITMLCASIITHLSYIFYSIKKLGIKFNFSGIDISLKKEIISFSFFIFLNLIIDLLYANTDKLILGSLKGTVAVSVYSIGIYFSQYFTQLSSSMSSVFMPQIMKLYQENQFNEISSLFNKVGRFQMILLFLVMGGFISLGKEFIELWVGKTYYTSYYIGIIVMIPAIVPLTQNVGISIIRAMNIHKYRSYMYLVIAIINVLISMPLARTYGGIGASIGTCFATILGQIIFMNWFYAKRVGINIEPYWKDMLKFALSTSITILLIHLIKTLYVVNSWFVLGLYVIVFIFIYTIIYMLFIMNTVEKKLFIDLLTKRDGSK